MKLVRNVPRLPNSLATYQGGQSCWTHPYEPQLTYSHRQHLPIQATTQGFLMSSAIPSHNSRYVIQSHNSRNATCFPLSRATIQRILFRATTQGTLQQVDFKVSAKPCRPHISKATNHKSCLCIITQHCSKAARRISAPDCLAEHICRQAPSVLKAPATTSITWRDEPHRQAPHITKDPSRFVAIA